MIFDNVERMLGIRHRRSLAGTRGAAVSNCAPIVRSLWLKRRTAIGPAFGPEQGHFRLTLLFAILLFCPNLRGTKRTAGQAGQAGHGTGAVEWSVVGGQLSVVSFIGTTEAAVLFENLCGTNGTAGQAGQAGHGTGSSRLEVGTG